MSESNFGRYQLLKKLAAGGMAEVYLAKQQGMEGFEKLLVVKRILPHLAHDEEFVQMFLNEARIAARFNHANIVQIYDLGKISDSYFIAMEYVHGEDLGRITRKAWNMGKWIPMPLALRMVAMACEGLFYAHSKTDENGNPLEVVHRDISPQNILISFDGGVKVVDFGIARAADSVSMTKSGTIKGKYAYMSPEQAEGKPVDCRADVFAIGLVLYELLTGVRPLKRDSDIVTLQAALACEIEPPSKVAQVPENLDAVVMKALAKRVDDRYQTAQEFQLALENYLVQKKLSASSVHVAELMKTLFADRLEEEARLGQPSPSGPSSQTGVPAVKVGKRSDSSGVRSSSARATAAPLVDEAPEERDDSLLDKATRIRPPSQPGLPRARSSSRVEARRAVEVEEPGEPPVEEERPRRSATSESRRKVAELVGNGGSRTRSTTNMAMPEAPPRKVTSSSQSVQSWKVATPASDTSVPHPKDEKRFQLCAVPHPPRRNRGSGRLLPRAHPQTARGGRPASRGAQASAGGPAHRHRGHRPADVGCKPGPLVSINGEPVGVTPLKNLPVKAGKASIRMFSEGQGVESDHLPRHPGGGRCEPP